MDWHAEEILSHHVSANKDTDEKSVFFRVQWLGGQGMDGHGLHEIT